MTISAKRQANFVFLHGGMQGGWVWEEVERALREQAGDDLGQVLRLDVPGCGAKRARDAAALSFSQVVDDLIGDIDAAGIGDALLVGHSQAGTVLPRLIEARGDRFRRAVYVACCAPLAGQTVVEMMGQALHGADPEHVGWPVDPAASSSEQLFAAMFCNDMNDAQRAAFQAKLGRDQWPSACGGVERGWRYDHLDQLPATYVVASGDNSLPEPWQLKFAERLKAAPAVRLDAGHQVMQTQPGALAAALLALATGD
jgi:pimeloyl-ACP methyl ester carboxylesterase